MGYKSIIEHDNVLELKAKSVQDTIKALEWELLRYPLFLGFSFDFFCLLFAFIDGTTCIGLAMLWSLGESRELVDYFIWVDLVDN